MALTTSSGPAFGGRSSTQPSWQPSAPTSEGLFSDLNPFPGGQRLSQPQPQRPMSTGASNNQTSSLLGSSSAYQAPSAVPHSHPLPQPSGPFRGPTGEQTPRTSLAQSSSPQAIGQNAWQSFSNSSTADQHGFQQVQHPPSSTPPPAVSGHEQQHIQQQLQQSVTEIDPEERERQYMQQQQQQQLIASHQVGNIPAAFHLPSDQQGSGNPFNAMHTEHSKASEMPVHNTGATHHIPSGEHNHQRQQMLGPERAQSSALPTRPQDSAADLFPRIDYDWANPAGASEQQETRTNWGPAGAPGGPSWPPPMFHSAGPGGHFQPPGPQAPPGYGPPYGPPGPPLGPPGTQYGPPPPMFYPPPPGPPPIVYVDDPYYYSHHNRNVGLAAGGLGGLALGALLF